MTTSTFEVWALLDEVELQLVKTFNNMEDAFDYAKTYYDFSDRVIVIEDRPKDS